MEEDYTKELARFNKRILRYAINGLGFITGAILYLPFYVLTDDIYLNPDNVDYFQKDLISFILTIFIVLAIGFVWFKIYKQFKKDKRVLGFSPETEGSMLASVAIAEAVISIVTAVFLNNL